LEKTQRKANVKNRITIITPPDDIAQDGVRILVYGCTKEQTLLISSVIYQLEECKPTIIYVSNGQNDSEWALDKKLKCSIIVFNAEADDQTMIGYLTAQTNSYYFGQLRSLDSVNNNRINTEEQLTTIIGDHIT
tara:strand:+ start:866 stop:1267 length:402 start_codon:yes stop_codon:yes gene_type:complete